MKAAETLIRLGASHSVCPRGFMRVYVPANLYSLSEKDLYAAIQAIYAMGQAAAKGEVIPLTRDGKIRGWIYGRKV